MRLPQYYIVLFLFLLISFSEKSLFAQKPDTLINANVENITDRLENIASGSDNSLDYSDLIDDYLYYPKHPLNLNSQNDIEKLINLRLINRLQADNLRVYILKYGHLTSIYELKYIKGFDNKTLQQIEPFVSAISKVTPAKLHVKNIFKYGRHRLIFRYGQFLQTPQGLEFPPDSAVKKSGSVYLGTPQKLYLRYGFDYRKKIRFGFTFEKDAGEVFLKNRLPDTIKQLVGDKISPFFDFYSGYAYISNMGIVKKAVIGDYHLEFGQGLNLWTGLSFGLSSDNVSVKKFGRGINPNTSTNENRFFRGTAVELAWRHFNFTGFYSQNKIDANLQSTDSIKGIDISSIQETGNHRTINELFDKRSTTLKAYGGHLQYQRTFFSIGATAYNILLYPTLIPARLPYKYFSFKGNEFLVYGMDANIVFGKWDLYGEFSSNGSNKTAGIIGFNAYLSDRFTFTTLYRNFGKRYNNLYNNPLAESSSVAGESGFYFGINSLLSRKFTLTAYADYYSFSWLKFQIDEPSQGRAYAVQLNYTPTRKIQTYFRFRYKLKQENNTINEEYLTSLTNVHRYEWRWNTVWMATDFLIFKSRFEYVRYVKNNKNQKGFLSYQDVLFRPENLPLQITLRFALFDTDGWESRIYAYENDVLYAFSVPAYYDKGRRFYVLFKWQARKKLNVWFRFAQTFFYNKTEIGSGSDQITGHNKSGIKIQIIWKL